MPHHFIAGELGWYHSLLDLSKAQKFSKGVYLSVPDCLYISSHFFSRLTYWFYLLFFIIAENDRWEKLTQEGVLKKSLTYLILIENLSNDWKIKLLIPFILVLKLQPKFYQPVKLRNAEFSH